jgi:hypothetical protein
MAELYNWLFSLTGLAALFTCFATLMVFSFLYRDNPLYKFAEHVFVGVSTGYSMVLIWYQVVYPNLIEKILVPEDIVRMALLTDGEILPSEFLSTEISILDRLSFGEWPYYIFAILGFMMLFKISKKLHWLSRWPLAYVIGAFAGIQIIQATQGALVPQLKATMKDFTGQAVVTRMLDESGKLPATEINSRQENIRSYYREYFNAELDESGLQRASREFEAWISKNLNSSVSSEILDTQPRKAFIRMRGQIFGIGEKQDEIQELFNSAFGGRPLVEAFALSSLGVDDVDFALADLRENNGFAEYLNQSLTLDCFESLELEPWQQSLYTMQNMVWLESVSGRQEIANVLSAEMTPKDAALAAEAFARPNGKVCLSELFKAEAFPDDWRGDWSDLLTHQIVDSLLKQVNSRPDNFSEWDASKVQDLRERLSSRGDGRRWIPDLSADLNARFGSLAAFIADKSPDEQLRITETLWQFWLKEFLNKATNLRSSIVKSGLKIYAGGDLNNSFTPEQYQEFRQNPESYMVESGLEVTNGNIRLQMIINIFSNLLVVIGVCTGIFYFFFSKKHTGALAVVSRVGIAFLMMSFGASFGYTVMGRISLAIGRFQDLLLYPWMAGFALIVLIIVLAIQSRKQAA